MGSLEKKVALSLRVAALLPFIVIGVTPLPVLAQQQYALLTPVAIIALTNAERSDAALVPYRAHQALAAAAEEKAKDMATRGYFSHSTPEGEKTWNLVREHGYEFSRVGENLAVKFSDPSRVVSSWLASPGHRANLLNEHFVDIGIGVAEGQYQDATTTFVVALFGTPLTGEENEIAGEVKGEQGFSQESAGLMASLEPDAAPPQETTVETEREIVAAEILLQQTAAASAGRLESLGASVANFFRALWKMLTF